MEKIDRFVDFINQKTDFKFESFRLKALSFNKSNNNFLVHFIYPQSFTLEQDDKNLIENAIKSYVPIDVNLILKLTKSYVEKDLIFNLTKQFLEKTHKLFFGLVNFEQVGFDVQNNVVTITFEVEKTMMQNFDKVIAPSLAEFLEHNFCAKFLVNFQLKNNEAVDSIFLSNRIDEVKLKSQIDSIMSANQDRFLVENKRVLVGSEITYNPRFIKSIKREYEDCVLAGTLSSLGEKSFASKRTKKDESGQEVPIIKPYFSFTLKDESGTIFGAIFPSKANYHKMNLLTVGQSVAVQGKIQKFNGNYEIVAKNISLCDIPSKNAVEMVSQNQIETYRYVRPHAYVSQRQQTLFDDRHISTEVQNGSFVVYDFETTGINLSNDQIVEIGALKVVKGEFVEVFTTLVKPTIPMPAEASRVNRITDDMLKNCFSSGQVIRDFYLFCKGCQMVGYNSLAFDKFFLDRAAKEVGINFDNTQIDVFLLAKQKLKNLKNYKLSTVATSLGVNLVDAHRALNDVIATAEVFLKLY